MQSVDAIYKDVVVLGCGNILFGDDGFGSCVAEHLLDSGLLPENVSVINAGTGVREILFDLILDEKKPKRIVIIDAIDANRNPGEIFRVDVEEIPKNKVDDFTLHHMPTVNLLSELKELCRVDVAVVAAQVEAIPEAVSPGLSEALTQSIPVAAEEVLKLCS